MNGFRVRVFISESKWMDIVIQADTWYNAVSLAEGSSPLGRAVLLGNV
jgi:hypothetical protein